MSPRQRLLDRIQGLFTVVRPWQRRYGFWAGARLGLQHRRLWYSAPSGTFVRLDVPGLTAPVFGRARTSDADVFRQIFLAEDLRFDYPIRPKTIVDAGANIGLSALYLHRLFPSARIICVEPDEGNCNLLEKNVESLEDCVVLRKAIWGHEARVLITNPDAAPASFRVEERKDGTIEALGIADLLETLHIDALDLLKLDIEGAEYEVFTDCPERWIERVRMILVEAHDRHRPGCTDAIETAIRSRGFIVRRSGEYLLLTVAL